MVLLESCSTKKNTWTRRTYHNLTSRYNVYWNGNESLKTGVADLRKSVNEDYSKVLRVFTYGSKADALKINASMERAIEKGAIGVQKHSMVFGGREQVRWIDDSYLMMGKAHFYKQDYISARRTFEFVNKQFSYNDITHTAELWLARTYIQLEQFERAAAILESLRAKSRDTEMPLEVRRTLSLVTADYHIARGSYLQAIPHLERGTKETNSKHLRIRSQFIIAQIYDWNSENNKAVAQYARVLKMNPPFDMAFEARIAMARNFDKSQGDSRTIVKSLERMLKDAKNIDFKAKIYFALAEIALEENQEEQAMDYLRLSVASSTRNKQQQAASSLKLAAMLFDRNDYVPSQAYYDTAVSALPRDYPGYDSIRNRAGILTDLVVNIETVQLQDSLLRLANMDSVARLAIIDGIIQKIVEEEKRKEQEEREMERNVMMANQFGDTRNQGIDASAGWYFYNPNTLSFGFTEFLRKWGRRKLEDYWRISDKGSLTFETIESVALAGGGQDGAQGDTVVFTEKDRGFYLRDIPLTEERKQESLAMIEESLNSLGYIYKERLNDFPRSRESYTTLLQRFPDSEFRLQAWYAMYKMFSDEQKAAEAAIYANLIFDNYPNTDYARVIQDPEYFIRRALEAGESLLLYEQTLQAYHNAEYFRVLLNSNRARSLYAEDVDLIPRFDFLRAIAKGRIEVVDSMAVALETLVKTYPTSEIAMKAASILRNLNKELNLNIDVPLLPGEEPPAPEEISPYNYEAQGKHLVMIIASNEKVRTDPLKVRLSDFNNRSFRSAQLMVRSLVLNEQYMLVTIGNFDNAENATDYRMAVLQSDYVFGGVNPADFFVFPVSLTNYPVFYRNKDIPEYERFWKKFYKE